MPKSSKKHGTNWALFISSILNDFLFLFIFIPIPVFFIPDIEGRAKILVLAAISWFSLSPFWFVASIIFRFYFSTIELASTNLKNANRFFYLIICFCFLMLTIAVLWKDLTTKQEVFCTIYGILLFIILAFQIKFFNQKVDEYHYFQ